MEHISTIRAAHGVTFTMRLVQNGERYGLNHCLVNEGEALVEFYDARFPFDRSPDGAMLGQFTGARYYVATLLRAPSRGLALDGRFPAWTLDPEAFALALATLRNWMAR